MLPCRSLQVLPATADASSSSSSSTKPASSKRIASSIDEASDNDAATAPSQSVQKQIKLDIDEKMNITPDENESTENVTVSLDNAEAQTKIDNLEQMPVEILERIFIETDYIGFLGLSDTCTKFEAIVKTLFSKRYFVINGERLGGVPDIYAAQLNRFGSDIRAIRFEQVEDIDTDHWALALIQQHSNHIKKLTFNNCVFKSNEVSWPNMYSVTHLTFRSPFHIRREKHERFMEIDLPECRNLTELEIHETDELCFSIGSLIRIISDNPTLQSLKLYDFDDDIIDLWTMLTLIADNVNQMKELALVSFDAWESSERPDSIYEIFKPFEHLESLSLSIDANTIEHLKHFGTRCKQIKHLGLLMYNDIDDFNSVLLDAAHSFQQIESFFYHSNDLVDIDIEPLVEQLPNLRHLSIEPKSQHNIECSALLPLFSKCPTLQRVAVCFKYNSAGYSGTFTSAQLFSEFIKITSNMGQQNAQIDVKEGDRIIGILSKDGIVWRNKLMYWMGCDKNQTNLNLLGLANHARNSNARQIDEAADADQSNLLDRIFDYLDVDSLHSLGATSKRSERLVQNYVKKHSDQNGMFTVTDEFFPFVSLNSWTIFHKFNFARFLNILKVYTFRSRSKSEIFDAISLPDHFDKLSIYDEYPEERWPHILPDIPNIVYDSSHCMGYLELAHLTDTFRDARTIEFKNAGLFSDFKRGKSIMTRSFKLKKFIFNYRDETQMENLKEIFKHQNTQLVPIFKVSA